MTHWDEHDWGFLEDISTGRVARVLGKFWPWLRAVQREVIAEFPQHFDLKIRQFRGNAAKTSWKRRF